MLASLFRFKGGVKPPTHKAESTGRPIAPAPLPSVHSPRAPTASGSKPNMRA